VAAIGAVVAAVLIVGFLMFRGGNSYTVSATFDNAGQLVKGNRVEVGGRPVGTVQDIKLTDDGRAEVKMKLKEFAPLHEGTRATIRSGSLSGIANRYVALQLGPNNRQEIADGGTITADRTTAPVDLDQLFATLDPATRKGLQDIIRGSADWYTGRSKQANTALKYFSPALSTSSALTRELVRDRVVFQRFVTDSSRAVTALADRRAELSQLVGNANATAGAIGDEQAALARSLGLLPGTLRKANTTFVNLRATLDDLDTLVDASKPATKDLAPFLRELRPLVHESQPTVRDLRKLIRTPGPGNDMIELLAKAPRLQRLTSSVFPRSIKALQKTQPVIEYARPYAPDLTGWFQKFAEAAANYDANGHYARIQPMFNAFQLDSTPVGDFLNAIPPAQRLDGLETRKSQRCPGGAMQPPPDGSAPYKETPEFSCDPTATPPGP
jgi:phospholipid/cholesterol/gamma-HCH transport system substrate-binding protein